MLLKGSQGCRLPGVLTLQVSLAMHVSLRCVQRIWNAGQKGGGIHAVANKRGNCGRKRIEVSPEAITAIPLKDRTTLENVARHLGMAKSTIFRRVKEGRIERHSISINPLLRNEDKRSCAQYYREMLEPQCSSSSCFKSNYNVTYMDKKWFYRTKSNQKFYCAPVDHRERGEAAMLEAITVHDCFQICSRLQKLKTCLLEPLTTILLSKCQCCCQCTCVDVVPKHVLAD